MKYNIGMIDLEVNISWVEKGTQVQLHHEREWKVCVLKKKAFSLALHLPPNTVSESLWKAVEQYFE